MSFQVDTAFVQSYRSNVTLLSQQMGSRLRPWVRHETQNSEFDYYDRISATDAVEVVNRHSDTPLISTPHDRRQVGLRDFDWADLIDRKDRIRMLADPTASYTQNAVAAMGRAMDDVIIDAVFGTAKTGKAGAGSQTHSNDIASTFQEDGSSVASNLTIGKLREARKSLKANEAVQDGEDLVFVWTADQEQSLLQSTEATSSDFNSVKALINGELNSFMGFQFVHTERLDVASSVRDCIAYARQGLLLATGEELFIDIGPRRDKRGSIQVYVSGSFGSVRMEEAKVYKVQCDESAA